MLVCWLDRGGLLCICIGLDRWRESKDSGEEDVELAPVFHVYFPRLKDKISSYICAIPLNRQLYLQTP